MTFDDVQLSASALRMAVSDLIGTGDKRMRDRDEEDMGMPLLSACLWATHLGQGIHCTLKSPGE